MNSKHVFQPIIKYFVLLHISRLFKSCIFLSFIWIFCVLFNEKWCLTQKPRSFTWKCQSKVLGISKYSQVYIFYFQSTFSNSFGFQRFFWQIWYSLKIVPHLIYKHKHTHITPFEVAKGHWSIPVKQDAKLFLGKEGRNEFHPLK